jgi:hypothetical protein
MQLSSHLVFEARFVPNDDALHGTGRAWCGSGEYAFPVPPLEVRRVIEVDVFDLDIRIVHAPPAHTDRRAVIIIIVVVIVVIVVVIVITHVIIIVIIVAVLTVPSATPCLPTPRRFCLRTSTLFGSGACHKSIVRLGLYAAQSD